MAEICPPKFPPWVRPNINICPVRVDKRRYSDAQLKTIFLEHASEHVNSGVFYTDGSKSSVGVGCSVITPDNVIKKRLPSIFSSFMAELLAVLTALRYIFFSNSSSRNFTIFTDSRVFYHL